MNPSRNWLKRILIVFAAISGAAFDGAAHCFGDILAAHFFSGNISRRDETTGVAINENFIPSGAANLAGPSGITVGPDGNIYVSSQFTGEVLRFNGTTGAAVPHPLGSGRDGLFATLPAGATPGLLRFGPDGHLYVTDANSNDENVRRVDGSSGVVLGNVVNGNQLDGAGFTVGITFAPDGHPIVGRSSPIFQGSILSVDALGNTTEIVPPGTLGLQSVNAMLVGPSNELYAVDLFGNQILKFSDVNGSNPQQFALIPPAIPDPLPTGAGFPSNFPSDVVFDRDGKLLVGVLGLTNPFLGGTNRGALLRYELTGGAPTILQENISPVSSVALIPAVPEPTTITLALLGTLILWPIARKWGARRK